MKKIILFISCCLLFSSVQATTSPDWLQHSLDIAKKIKIDKSLIHVKPTEEQRKLAAELLQSSRKITSRAMVKKEAGKITNPAKRLYKKAKTFIFLSFSIPESQLKSIINTMDTDGSTAGLIQGLKKGMNITQTMNYLQSLLKNKKNQPSVFINPAPFKKYSIDVAPTILQPTKNGFISAAGIVNRNWLDEQRKAGKKDYLGKYGTTYPVIEENLIDVMKRRMAAIDPEKEKQKMIANYWKERHFETLQPAQKDRAYLIDPSLHIMKDIRTPDGILVARKGQVINPLDRAPLTKTIVIFNPNRQAELRYVKAMSDRFYKKTRGMILIATQIQRKNGWQVLKNLRAKLKYPIYLLSKAVEVRFHLKVTPTVISEQGKKLKMEEIHVSNL